MSTSNSLRQLNCNSGQKVIARNQISRSTINIGDLSSTSRQFSRKPLNQTDYSSLQTQNKNDHKQLNIDLIEKSVQDTRSVVSGQNSIRQTKFVRTNKMSFLSPKSNDNSKDKSRGKSISSNYVGGTKSFITKGSKINNGKTQNNSIHQNEDSVSQAFEEQTEIILKKSTSSQCLMNKSKTRTMVVSKFNDPVGKRIPLKENKDMHETSLYTFCAGQSQRDEKIKLEKFGNQLKLENEEYRYKCGKLEGQNLKIKKENNDLKQQITELMRKINILAQSKINTIHQEKITPQSPSSTASFASIARMKSTNSMQQNTVCQKCEQRQISQQKHVVYLENIIKKRQLQICSMKKQLTQLNSQKSQLSLTLQQSRSKLHQLLQREQISFQTQQRLQQCITSLKQQISKLKDELRYLKIQNSVLLKIKNQNLKLKIDITKIQDQKDYFKMKVVEINKKNSGSLLLSSSHRHHPINHYYKSVGEKYLMNNNKDKFSLGKRSINSQLLKKFYMDSTETEEMDGYEVGLNRRNRSKSAMFDNDKDRQSKNSKQQQTETTIYSDPLFDLSSEQSENN